MTRWVIFATIGIASITVTAMLVAARTWRAGVAEFHQEVMSGAEPTTTLPLNSTPEPVARYLARSLPSPTPQVESARLHQKGTFQMGEGEDAWRRFTAEEVFRVNPPAFYWDARIEVAPGFAAFVRDSYLRGSAEMLGKVAGLITVVHESNSPQLASGALARYLAEAVWFPTRLATGPNLIWTPVDDTRARATLTDEGTTVSLIFTFNDAGDPIRVEGERARATESGFVNTPWIGTFSDHADVQGFRIPRYGEVGWVVDGELVLYWRGRVQAAEYH